MSKRTSSLSSKDGARPREDSDSSTMRAAIHNKQTTTEEKEKRKTMIRFGVIMTIFTSLSVAILLHVVRVTFFSFATEQRDDIDSTSNGARPVGEIPSLMPSSSHFTATQNFEYQCPTFGFKSAAADTTSGSSVERETVRSNCDSISDLPITQ